MIKTIIFDFDWVIVDTFDYNKNISSKVCWVEITNKDFKDHHNWNVYEKPIIPFTKDITQLFFSEYYKNVCLNKSFCDEKDLKFLKENYKLNIVSSNSEKAMNKFLNYNKLEYFEEILWVESWKSKVKKIEYLIKKYNYKKDEIMFVTDTIWDIFEANKVWVKTIAVSYGYHEIERLEKWNPFKIVSSFEEILRVLENL